MSGDTLVVGSLQEASNATGVNGDQTDNSAPDAGAAYVFVRSGTTWSQQAYIKASNAEGGDEFWRPELSGDLLVMGATKEDSAATGVNGDESDNSAEDSGAAYIFGLTVTVSTPSPTGAPSTPTPRPSSTPTGTATLTVTVIVASTATATRTPTVLFIGTPTPSPPPTLPPTVSGTEPPVSTPTQMPTATLTMAPDGTATPSTPLADANCDSTVSVADVPALVSLIASGEASPCGTGDVNGDSVFDESDIEALLAILFGG